MKQATLIEVDEEKGRMTCQCVNPKCCATWKRAVKHQGGMTTCKECDTDQFNPKYIKGVDNEDLGWLTNCPATDINFKLTLKDSSIETMMEALKDPTITKTARKAIDAQLARKIKEVKN